MKDEVLGTKAPKDFSHPFAFRLHPSSFPLVPLAVPYWNGATYGAILRSLLSGAIIDGPDLRTLKSSVIDRFGVADALLCGSGSLALELALRACAVGKDDEVIIPAFCCSAVVPPILAVGAKPVLADVDEELNLTADTVDAVITKNTKAVIVPHLFGNPADIKAIVEVCHRKNIRVIDDAAQALGATVEGQPAGSFGDAGILSFGNEKVCFGLGGGVLVTNQPELFADGARGLASTQLMPVLAKLAATQFHRRWRRWTLPVQKFISRGANTGLNNPPVPYRRETMANLQAAVALSLVQTVEENIAARRARVNAYRQLLGNEPGLELIAHRAGSACLTQVVRVLPKRRGYDVASALIAALGNNGYEIQGSYVPIHLLQCFDQCVWDALPRTERVWNDFVELPCEPSVSLNDVERISSVFKNFLRMDASFCRRESMAGGSTTSDGLC